MKKIIPNVLIIVFYFLHEGAHVKTDINNDLMPALKRIKYRKIHTLLNTFRN